MKSFEYFPIHLMLVSKVQNLYECLTFIKPFCLKYTFLSCVLKLQGACFRGAAHKLSLSYNLSFQCRRTIMLGEHSLRY